MCELLFMHYFQPFQQLQRDNSSIILRQCVFDIHVQGTMLEVFHGYKYIFVIFKPSAEIDKGLGLNELYIFSLWPRQDSTKSLLPSPSRISLTLRAPCDSLFATSSYHSSAAASPLYMYAPCGCLRPDASPASLYQKTPHPAGASAEPIFLRREPSVSLVPSLLDTIDVL